MSIRYVYGNALRPEGSGPRIIAHCCNDAGKWGSGFVVALSEVWKEPERRYRAWARGELPGAPPLSLGMVQIVPVEENLWVANLIGQRDVYRGTRTGEPPVRYDALRQALEKLAEIASRRSASVHLPRIASDRAGGVWWRVEALLQECLVAREVPVTVYDLNEASRRKFTSPPHVGP